MLLGGIVIWRLVLKAYSRLFDLEPNSSKVAKEFLQFSVSVKAVDQILVAGHRAFADSALTVDEYRLWGPWLQMRFEAGEMSATLEERLEKRLTCYLRIYHYSACWGDCFLLAGGLLRVSICG